MTSPHFADADLVVLADGINSRFRDKYAEHFQPEVDLRSNMFAWMGSTRPLDAFTFIFQETEWGPFIAHAYQYEVGPLHLDIRDRSRNLQARRA